MSPRLIQGLTALAVVAVVVLVLWLKPEWWRGEPVRPEFKVFLSAQEPRIPLLDGFRSYDNEQQVTRQLEAAGLKIEAERVHVEGTGKYPPYKLDILTVREYSHLGHAGNLVLSFFNDRLATTTFQPSDGPKAYLRQVQKQGIKFKHEDLSRWAQESDHQRVTTNIIFATSHVGSTLKTPPYVSWADKRLTAQSRQWYDDYGSKYAISPMKTLGPGVAP